MDDKDIEMSEPSADELRRIACRKLEGLAAPRASEAVVAEMRRKVARWVGRASDNYVRTELGGVMDDVEDAFTEDRRHAYKRMPDATIKYVRYGVWYKWNGVLLRSINSLWLCQGNGRGPQLIAGRPLVSDCYLLEVALTGSRKLPIVVRQVPVQALGRMRIPIPVQPLRENVRADGTGRIDVAIPELRLRATFNYYLG